MIDAILSIGGLIIPPIFSFIKSKFLKHDTVQETANTLAISDPEKAAEYIKANGALIESQIKWFNRDVIGQPSLWVINLRASVRPLVVVVGLSIMAYNNIFTHNIILDPAVKALFEVTISSWFGSRLVKR